MTSELLEFRKWGVIACLIDKFSDYVLEPVVLNIDRIALLIIWQGKSFFFYASESKDAIVMETCNADTDEIISICPLFSEPMREDVTFRQIADLIIAKTLT